MNVSELKEIIRKEPLFAEWLDQETRLLCRILRHTSEQHLCGYVRLPPNHFLYKYSNLSSKYKAFSKLDKILTVHGGVTFFYHLNPFQTTILTENDYFIGFDCARGRDIQPGDWMTFRDDDDQVDEDNCTYRTFDYVKNECKSLAKQIDRIKESYEEK